MSKIVDKLSKKQFSRRTFLKGSATAVAAITTLSLVGCNSNQVTEPDQTAAPADSTAAPSEKPTGVTHAPIANPEEGGKWVTAACWHNCGGRCMNKVMVKDGVVVRQKTDDTHPDSYDYPQQRACVRGHAQQQQCFGADRIKYPMKRKNWEPTTGGKRELRGIDEWERITWDEAAKYVADELTRIKSAYGNEAFLVTGYGSRNSCKVLNAFGGHSSDWDTTSAGTFMQGAHWGMPTFGGGSSSDRYDMLNAETIVLHSSNPAWSASGNPINLLLKCKERGVKFICIDPMYNISAQLLDAKWLPVRNGTDTAFLLAVAYEMIRLDKEGEGLIDWDFLHKYTLGFDAESMPEDALTDENFMGYVLGEYDGIPKDPAWATEICGIAPEEITWFARELTKQKKVMYMYNYGAMRCNGAENLPQLLFTVGLMGGHMGKSGHAIGSYYHANGGNGGPRLVGSGSTGNSGVPNPIEESISGTQVWKAVLDGKYHYAGDCWSGGLKPGEEHEINIQCIFHDDAAYLQTGPNMVDGIKAHRKVEFVVSKAQFLTTNAKYSDIILPVTTEWERVGGFSTSNKEFMVCYTQVTEPLFEAKTDMEIDTLLLTALGIDPSTVYAVSEKQAFFNQIAGSWYMDENMQKQTLVTITQADIDAWGVEGTPQEGKITIEELFEMGGYQVERHEGDNFGYIGMKAFVDDPDNNPVYSKSGKFEIYCQAKADEQNFVKFDENPVDYKPYPMYIKPVVGYETTFKDGVIGGEKSEFPFLLYNPHYLRRSHSVFDNCPWLREAWQNPAFISATDAKAKGIEIGDTILVTTPYGKALRQAAVLETLLPGVIGIPHGSWVDMDEATGIDKGGADNILLGPIMGGIGTSGYNNLNCNFEKYTGEELTPDHLKPQNIFPD